MLEHDEQPTATSVDQYIRRKRPKGSKIPDRVHPGMTVYTPGELSQAGLTGRTADEIEILVASGDVSGFRLGDSYFVEPAGLEQLRGRSGDELSRKLRQQLEELRRHGLRPHTLPIGVYPGRAYLEASEIGKSGLVPYKPPYIAKLVRAGEIEGECIGRSVIVYFPEGLEQLRLRAENRQPDRPLRHQGGARPGAPNPGRPRGSTKPRVVPPRTTASPGLGIPPARSARS